MVFRELLSGGLDREKGRRGDMHEYDNDKDRVKEVGFVEGDRDVGEEEEVPMEEEEPGEG